MPAFEARQAAAGPYWTSRNSDIVWIRKHEPTSDGGRTMGPDPMDAALLIIVALTLSLVWFNRVT